MALTVTTVQITGTPDTDEKQAMKMIIDQENARRAALIPPGTPLPQSTAIERKASYEACFVQIDQNAHASYVEQAKETVTKKELFMAYEAAGKSTKDTVNAALGITGP